MGRGQARIRPYRPSDLDELYRICLLTGDAGQDATALYQDPRLLGHIFAAPSASSSLPWPSWPKMPPAWADTSSARSTPRPSRNGWKATGGPDCAAATQTPGRPA